LKLLLVASVMPLLAVFSSLGRGYFIGSPVTTRYAISVMNPTVVMA